MASRPTDALKLVNVGLPVVLRTPLPHMYHPTRAKLVNECFCRPCQVAPHALAMVWVKASLNT